MKKIVVLMLIAAFSYGSTSSYSSAAHYCGKKIAQEKKQVPVETIGNDDIEFHPLIIAYIPFK